MNCIYDNHIEYKLFCLKSRRYSSDLDIDLDLPPTVLPLSLTFKIGREGEVIESLLRQDRSATDFKDEICLGLIRSKRSDIGSLKRIIPFNSLKSPSPFNVFTFTL
jgi:hypothetical protein